ncbi:hypothetical protein [Belnapia rosea]|uniref:Uncharacterized protein n=1 Tax=Belnapia rosea TaxID=938405 RepID=A0A1G6RV66_9PROT|nr:hypothetical protein [Belnapia rosea]SDB71927.1 hypothetical protein SAMN02927895_04239 [Belnapia rosea]SDD08542.1 hypothetical protein SAMN04487779_1004152 [Belnapia rosea]
MSHTQDRPDQTRDANVEAAVEDTFPASDPVGNTTSQGSRAVPPQDMMPKAASTEGADLVSFSMSFPNQASAKLALETLVREGPIDRRGAEITHEGDKASLRVSAPRADAERLKSLLERSPEAQ